MVNSNASIVVDEKVLARIQKLLTLAEHETSNVGEAGNAASKVQELLDIHNLEMSQIRAYDVDGGIPTDVIATYHAYGPYTSALNKAWNQLMETVSRQHNCSLLLSSEYVPATEAEKKKSREVRRSGYKRVAQFMIIGDPTNVGATITVFDWLRRQLEIEATREWPIYRDDMLLRRMDTGDPIPFRVNFVLGATRTINRIMTERRKARENHAAVTALAVNHKKANDEFVTENYEVNKGTYQHSKAEENDNAYRRGMDAGARVERSREGSLKPGGDTTRAIR